MMNWINSFTFAHPWLLLAIPVLIVGYIIWSIYLKDRQITSLQVSSLQGAENSFSIKGYLRKFLPFLRLITLCLIVIALARPQTTDTNENISVYGIDIIFAMDVSSSMLARDFKPNRLEVAKEVAAKFIKNRPADRFGVITFSGESFTQVPLTTDKNIVLEQLDKVQQGLLEDGTAIGMGIATGINRLKESDAKSKVIILMTDGENNAGLIDPILATEIATQFETKIYTIGVGSKGTALQPAYQNDDGSFEYEYLPVNIDETLLKQIATETGGQYYRAEDKNALETIYSEIDQLEKTEIESSQTIRVAEEYYPFAFLAICMLFLEIFLRYVLLRSFP